jgi:hypothetical protein
VYQSIDDNPNNESPVEKRPLNFWPLIIGLGFIASVWGTVHALRLDQPVNRLKIDLSQAGDQIYRKALAEPNPALRRARLNDYVMTFKKGQHESAALGQIDVINRYEISDWDILQDKIYNSDLKKAAKLDALNVFEANWGGSYIGTREDDIDRLRKEILGLIETDTLPDRRLEENTSPIPDTIPDEVLAGGPRPKVTKVAKSDPSDEDEEDINDETESDEGDEDDKSNTPLRVRRNGKLVYPSKAMRRNIGAVVTLKLDINEKGRVETTELVSVDAERYGKDFVKAAERAAMRSRYYAKIVDGEPVAVSGIVKRFRFEPE